MRNVSAIFFVSWSSLHKIVSWVKYFHITENSLTLITLWSSEVYSKQAPNCTSSLSYLGGCGNKNWKFFVGACSSIAHTAILYRASTRPEQGFPCEVFHTGKNLFSLQGTPVLIAGTPVFNTGISLWENFTGRTLFSLQGMGLQCIQFFLSG